MRIAIMGSGGLGGYFGARLAASGCDVAFIARGAHLEAIRRNGLSVESRLGDLRLPQPRVTDNPAELEPPDFVFFCVKLWDSEAAAKQIAPIVGPQTTVISFQNGVQKDELLRREFGQEPLMGGVAYIATAIDRPGIIKHTGTMQRLLFGEYDGSRSVRGQALLDACLKAGIDAELSADIRREIWDKFVFLVGLSATTTTVRLPIGAIRENPQSRALLLDVMREAAAVGRAQGVNLPPDYADQRLAFCDGLPADMTSSMHHDLERGNRLEVAWLSGGVVKLGERTGIPTPANRAVAGILSPHAGGRASA